MSTFLEDAVVPRSKVSKSRLRPCPPLLPTPSSAALRGRVDPVLPIPELLPSRAPRERPFSLVFPVCSFKKCDKFTCHEVHPFRVYNGVGFICSQGLAATSLSDSRASAFLKENRPGVSPHPRPRGKHLSAFRLYTFVSSGQFTVMESYRAWPLVAIASH